MYSIDERDRVIDVDGLPGHSVGAPLPVVIADEGRLLLAYLTAPDSENLAVLKFSRVRAHRWGPPNDETLHGHALYERGLRWYAIQEVIESSWIRGLERLNSVHRNHVPGRSTSSRHYVFAFHDSLFECIARDVELIALLELEDERRPDAALFSRALEWLNA